TELALSTRMKRNANTLKNYQGKLKGLRNIELVKQKQEEDLKMVEFINNDLDLKSKYGNLMSEIDNLYKQVNRTAYRDLWFLQIYNSSSLLKVAKDLNSFKSKLEKEAPVNREAYFKKNYAVLEKSINDLYASYDLDLDKSLFKNMLERSSKLPLNQKIAFIDNKIKGFNTLDKIDQFANNLFQFSKLNDKNFTFRNILKDAKSILEYNDPLLNFEKDLAKQINFQKIENDRIEGRLNKLMADYVSVKEVYLNKNFIPDANSTLRLTYGKISGYSPADGSYMHPFTTIKGI